MGLFSLIKKISPAIATFLIFVPAQSHALSQGEAGCDPQLGIQKLHSVLDEQEKTLPRNTPDISPKATSVDLASKEATPAYEIDSVVQFEIDRVKYIQKLRERGP